VKDARAKCLILLGFFFEYVGYPKINQIIWKKAQPQRQESTKSQKHYQLSKEIFPRNR
jgi:hypothetical protein